MSDAEHASVPPADDVELDHELSGVEDVKSEDVLDPQSEPEGDADTASSSAGNEVHAVEESEHDVAAEGMPSEPTHESGAEPAVTVDAPGVSQEAGAAVRQKPTGDVDKTVRKTTASASASPGRTGKSASGPNPVVKKVISSGTFGSGSVKPTPPIVSKAASTSTISKPSTTLRKSTSVAGAPASKPPSSGTKVIAAKATTSSSKPTKSTMSSVRSGNSPSQTPVPSTATRRPTVPPKPPLSSSAAARRPSSPETTRLMARTVVSPAESVGTVKSTTSTTTANRPRASMPMPDRLPARRTSMGPKPTPPASAKPTLAPRRTQTSISSMIGIKEDNVASEELQKKLTAAQSSLHAQTKEAASLQDDLDSARAQLDAALSDARGKQIALENLQLAKDATEEELSTRKLEIEKLQADAGKFHAELEDIKGKLSAVDVEIITKSERVKLLEDQMEMLAGDNNALRRELESARDSVASASEASAAAAVEHEALLKARADLDAIKAEASALSVAHEIASKQASDRDQELKAALIRADELAMRVTELSAEKEENANKLSELEVEILELKEMAEKAEDEEGQALTRIRELEEQIAKAASASEQALIETKKRDEEHERALNDARRQHEDALRVAGAEQDSLALKLKDLGEELSDAITRHEQALADASSAEQAHAAELEKVEKLRAEKADELAAEIERLASELAGQEAQYAAKIEVVKKEHDQLLQDVFQQAKTEAGDAHAHDLHDLRTQSQAMIEQLNAAHKSYIEELKAEHEAILDSKVKVLEKTISSQSLELKATQDDLAKAKAALAASVPEIEALKKQIEEAEKAAAVVAASSSSEHASEVIRLTRELSSANDEMVALKEVLSAQKDSISEMSHNHSTELEVAAKSRAEEVTKLRSEHEEEMSAHIREKSMLMARVSDLDGELATLRATMAAQIATPVSTKGNGVVPTGSASVSKEELMKLHEAHNLRLHDLEAQNKRAVEDLQGDLNGACTKSNELQNEVDRKSMEINYLESEVEEKDDTITRLKEDIAQLSEQLEKFKATA
ncbi:hypothetical protein M0805_003381 [Coniferiporia weirii]|nr:hypothetical protein M0805_003381 [Coniferiporia weirii]